MKLVDVHTLRRTRLEMSGTMCSHTQRPNVSSRSGWGQGEKTEHPGIIWAVCSKLLRTVSKQGGNLQGCLCVCVENVYSETSCQGVRALLLKIPLTPLVTLQMCFVLPPKTKTFRHTALKGLFRQIYYNWISGISVFFFFIPFSTLNYHYQLMLKSNNKATVL